MQSSSIIERKKEKNLKHFWISTEPKMLSDIQTRNQNTNKILLYCVFISEKEFIFSK
jgi:hypothetical protein